MSCRHANSVRSRSSRPASPLGWIASRWPGLLAEIRRVLPDLEIVAGDMDAEEMLNRAIATGAQRATAERASAAGQPAAGVHDAAGIGRQVATQLRQDALDHNAEAAAAAVLRARRRRRWRAQPQPAAAEPAAGQRPRHHSGSPARHPVSRMERVDEELHAGPRRGARARRTPAARVSRCRSPPTCGNGSKNTPIGR